MRTLCITLLLIALLAGTSCRTRKALQTEKSIEGRSSEIAGLLDSLDLSTPAEIHLPSIPAPRQDVLQLSKEQTFRLIHTRLRLTPNWDSASLNGIARLRLTPWFYPADSLILDAKSFDIASIQMIRPVHQALSFSYTDSLKIRIALGQTYSRTDTLEIEITYSAHPDRLNQGGGTAITSNRGLYFINPSGKDPYRPRQLWTQGEPESASCWFPTLDAPNQKSSQELYLTVPDSMISLSNGKLISSQQNPGGTRTDYWRQDKPHAPYLFMMAAGHFSRIQDKWNNMPVDYYVEPAYAPYAQMIFGKTPEMITWFSQRFQYPYPWDKYAQIVVREFVSGAMENTGAVVHFEFLNQDSLAHQDGSYEDIIAHELVHHWFGNLVTAESWSHIALNEAFASYGEYLWKEHHQGRMHADLQIHEELEVYLNRSGGKRKPLVRHYYQHPDDVFDVHSYQKGACILHYMRSVTGDEAFFEILSRYLKRYAYGTAEADQFRLIVEEVTGKNYKIFFDQWFHSPGHPVLDMEKEWDEISGEVSITLRQSVEGGKGEAWELPLTLAVYEGAVPVMVPLVLQTRDTVIRYRAEKNPKAVVLDPYRVIPARIREKRSVEEWAFLIQQSESAILRTLGIEELSELLPDEGIMTQLSEIAADTSQFFPIRISAMQALSYYDGPSGMKLTLEALNWCRDRQLPVRTAACELLTHQLGQLAAEQRQEDALKRSLLGVLREALSDSGYLIRSYALDGLFLLEEDSARAHARKMAFTRSPDLLTSALRILRYAEDSLYLPVVLSGLESGLPAYYRFLLLGLMEGETEKLTGGITANRCITVLENLLRYDPMPAIRKHSATLLDQLGETLPEFQTRVQEILQNHLLQERDSQVQEKIRSLLAG